MLGSVILTAFMIGLLGGIHCASMCGGIIAAFANSRGKKTIQVYRSYPLIGIVKSTLAYHLGRISSYMVLGALVASWGPLFLKNNSVPAIAYVMTNILLIMIGVNLLYTFKGRKIEAAFLVFFRTFQPKLSQWIAKLMYIPSLWGQIILGFLWGLIPCGMVYSVLALAAFSAEMHQGALIMLVFGIGTLPNLLLMGSFLKVIRHFFAQLWVKKTLGVCILSFGLLGLVRLAHLDSFKWLGYCITN